MSTVFVHLSWNFHQVHNLYDVAGAEIANFSFLYLRDSDCTFQLSPASFDLVEFFWGQTIAFWTCLDSGFM